MCKKTGCALILRKPEHGISMVLFVRKFCRKVCNRTMILPQSTLCYHSQRQHTRTVDHWRNMDYVQRFSKGSPDVEITEDRDCTIRAVRTNYDNVTFALQNLCHETTLPSYEEEQQDLWFSSTLSLSWLRLLFSSSWTYAGLQATYGIRFEVCIQRKKSATRMRLLTLFSFYVPPYQAGWACNTKDTQSILSKHECWTAKI